MKLITQPGQQSPVCTSFLLNEATCSSKVDTHDTWYHLYHLISFMPFIILLISFTLVAPSGKYDCHWQSSSPARPQEWQPDLAGYNYHSTRISHGSTRIQVIKPNPADGETSTTCYLIRAHFYTFRSVHKLCLLGLSKVSLVVWKVVLLQFTIAVHHQTQW